MARWARILTCFITAREEGASAAEYAMGLMLIVIVTVVAMNLFGSALSSFFVSAAGTI